MNEKERLAQWIIDGKGPRPPLPRAMTAQEKQLAEMFERACAGDASAITELEQIASSQLAASIQPELDDEQMPAAWRPRVPFRLRAGLWALRVGLKLREHAADILYFVVLGVLLYLVGRFLPAPPPR